MFKVPSTLTQWMVPERLRLQTRRRKNYRTDGFPVVKHRGSSDRGATLYTLTPWSRVLLEKITGLQLVKKFPAYYGSRRLITAVTSARHLSLFRVSSIQSIPPHPTFWRSILILSTHLSLGLPSVLFPSGFPPPQNPIHASPLPQTRYMPRPSHSSGFNHPKNIWWRVHIIKLLM